MAPTPRLKLPKQNQPGPGAPGTGGGRDTPEAGKDRGGFERDRARDRGTGKDRPPVYSPRDDGERGGYVGRSMAPGGGGRFAAFVSKLESQGKSASSAAAIAASAGRKKYGAAQMSKWSAKGRK